MKDQVLTFAEIKKRYPDQWVLIGNPVMDESFIGSVVSKLKAGVVLLWSKDRKELGAKAMEVRKGFENIACVFTGEIPKDRKYWL